MMSTSSFASASVSPPPISSSSSDGGAGRERAGEFEALAVDEAERLRAPVGDAVMPVSRKRVERARA